LTKSGKVHPTGRDDWQVSRPTLQDKEGARDTGSAGKKREEDKENKED
jgi:hypothetical protein